MLFGPLRMGMKTFVATTTSSRFTPRSRNARPRNSSLVPPEYTLAVSKKLMPASSACT